MERLMMLQSARYVIGIRGTMEDTNARKCACNAGEKQRNRLSEDQEDEIQGIHNNGAGSQQPGSRNDDSDAKGTPTGISRTAGDNHGETPWQDRTAD